jgi:mono/diheme cytochrome c family protein
MVRDRQQPNRSKVLGRTTLAALIAAAVTILLSAAASAEDLNRGRKIWHDKAGCDFCHGWAGDGEGGFHHPGHAPSLRETQLTREQIRMTVQCGRPGTAMPHFDRFAYTDKRCYGMTAADFGDLLPDRSATTLQPEEIDAIADYVNTKVKGAGAVTRAQCIDYFGGATSRCDMYAGQ